MGFDVYVASSPLRIPSGPPTWLFSGVQAAGFNVPRHYITVVQPHQAAACTVFDFQPLNPEDLSVALTALSGRGIPGIVQERKLPKLPRGSLFVGRILPHMGMECAIKFNKSWDDELVLWKHDCRHHTAALVEYLTGSRCLLSGLDAEGSFSK